MSNSLRGMIADVVEDSVIEEEVINIDTWTDNSKMMELASIYFRGRGGEIYSTRVEFAVHDSPPAMQQYEDIRDAVDTLSQYYVDDSVNIHRYRERIFKSFGDRVECLGCGKSYSIYLMGRSSLSLIEEDITTMYMMGGCYEVCECVN